MLIAPQAGVPLVSPRYKTLFVFNTVSSILRHVPPDGPQMPGVVPDPTKGPGPPKDSSHLAPDSPSVQQTEGVRQALNERRATIMGQNNQMMGNLDPGMSPPLGGSPF